MFSSPRGDEGQQLVEDFHMSDERLAEFSSPRGDEGPATGRYHAFVGLDGQSSRPLAGMRVQQLSCPQ